MILLRRDTERCNSINGLMLKRKSSSLENGRKNKAPVLSLSKETHKVEIEDGVQKLFEWYKGALE